LNCSAIDTPSPLGPVRFSLAPATNPKRVSLLVSEATWLEGVWRSASQRLAMLDVDVFAVAAVEVLWLLPPQPASTRATAPTNNTRLKPTQEPY
jgi:hypothetical protein